VSVRGRMKWGNWGAVVLFDNSRLEGVVQEVKESHNTTQIPHQGIREEIHGKRFS